MVVKSSARYLTGFWVLLMWLAKEEKSNKEEIASLGRKQEYTLQIVRMWGKPSPLQIHGLTGFAACKRAASKTLSLAWWDWLFGDSRRRFFF